MRLLIVCLVFVGHVMHVEASGPVMCIGALCPGMSLDAATKLLAKRGYKAPVASSCKKFMPIGANPSDWRCHFRRKPKFGGLQLVAFRKRLVHALQYRKANSATLAQIRKRFGRETRKYQVRNKAWVLVWGQRPKRSHILVQIFVTNALTPQSRVTTSYFLDSKALAGSPFLAERERFFAPAKWKASQAAYKQMLHKHKLSPGHFRCFRGLCMGASLAQTLQFMASKRFVLLDIGPKVSNCRRAGLSPSRDYLCARFWNSKKGKPLLMWYKGRLAGMMNDVSLYPNAQPKPLPGKPNFQLFKGSEGVVGWANPKYTPYVVAIVKKRIGGTKERVEAFFHLDWSILRKSKIGAMLQQHIPYARQPFATTIKAMQSPSVKKRKWGSFPIRVLAKTNNGTPLSRAVVFVNGKKIGETDDFGSFAGAFRGSVGQPVALTVVGQGKHNSLTLKALLSLRKGKSGALPATLRLEAHLRSR